MRLRLAGRQALPPFFKQRQAFGVAAHEHAFGRVDGGHARQKARGHATGHQQRFGGVAGAVFLGFGVVGHFQGQIFVARLVHVGVAHAVQVLDDGHFGFGADALDQAAAAARDDDVHVLRHGNERAHGGAIGRGHQLHAVRGQAAFFQRLRAQGSQRLAGRQGFAAAAQDAGVAAFDGQRRRLDGHVRPAFVNHAEHAQRHAHLPHADAAGLLAQAGDFANHVGHGRQLLAALRSRFDDGGRELEAVAHGRAQFAGAGQIACIGLLQGGGVFAQQPRQRAQGAAFAGGAGAGHVRCGGAGLAAQGVHEGGQAAVGVLFSHARHCGAGPQARQAGGAALRAGPACAGHQGKEPKTGADLKGMKCRFAQYPPGGIAMNKRAE